MAVAVRINLDKTITLCSVYIPPNSSLSLTQLKHLADQLPTPFIIMGDFKCDFNKINLQTSTIPLDERSHYGRRIGEKLFFR
jgi:hypothetical protein